MALITFSLLFNLQLFYPTAIPKGNMLMKKLGVFLYLHLFKNNKKKRILRSEFGRTILQYVI